MKIDHIGYAVKRMDRAVKAFETLGFSFEEAIDDTARNVKLLFGVKDGYRVELVQPLSKDQPSPVDTYLDNLGPTPYHICYLSDALNNDISDLVKKGFKIVQEAQPAVAFGGRQVVFLMNLGIGLIEIVEKESDSYD